MSCRPVLLTSSQKSLRLSVRAAPRAIATTPTTSAAPATTRSSLRALRSPGDTSGTLKLAHARRTHECSHVGSATLAVVPSGLHSLRVVSVRIPARDASERLLARCRGGGGCARVQSVVARRESLAKLYATGVGAHPT